MSKNQVQEKTFEQMIKPKDDSRLSDLAVIAQAFAVSGYFKDFDPNNARRGAAQALVKILRGQDLGISPSASVENVYIIDNKTALSAHLMAGLIRRSGADFDIEENDEKSCKIAFYSDPSREILIGRSSFTIQKAQRAGLTGRNNWKSYPGDMLYSRAISRGFRRFFSHLSMGAVYTPEELGYDDNSRDTVEIEQSHIEAEEALYRAVGVGKEGKSEQINSKSAPITAEKSTNQDKSTANQDKSSGRDLFDGDGSDIGHSSDIGEESETSLGDDFRVDVLREDLFKVFGTREVTKDMLTICELAAPKPPRGKAEIKMVEVKSIYDLSADQFERCLGVFKRLRDNKQYSDDRIFDFFVFAIEHRYLLNTTRNIDAACTEFVDSEREL